MATSPHSRSAGYASDTESLRRVLQPRGDFSKAPLTFLFGQPGDLRQIARDAGPTGPHAGKVRGIVAADAGDAPLRPGRVEFDALNIVNDGFCAMLGRMLDSALSIFDGRFSQRNETLQSRWDFLVGVGLGAGLTALVAQIVCQRAV